MAPHQATMDALVLHKGMELMVGCEKLSASWFMLEDSGRPIGDFVVDVVPIVPLAPLAQQSFDFYPRLARQRRPNRYQAKRRKQAASGEQEQPAGGADKLSSDSDNDGGDASSAHVEADAEEDALNSFMAQFEEELLQRFEPVDDVGAAAARAGEAAPNALGPEAVPPPPPPLVVADDRRRNRAAATVVFRWGKIAFYESKSQFEVVCRNPAHGKCVLTRTSRSKARSVGQAPAGGRPLGFLAAWLDRGDVADKAAHWSPEVLRSSKAARSAGRAYIKDAAQGLALLAYERPKAAEGEESEPDDVGAYV